MRILIVEDNLKLAGYMQKALKQKGYSVDMVHDGESGEKYAKIGKYDLLILDIMLPKKDGVSVCRDLRDENINLPIIMLTAKGELDDKIEGLDSGADDYLVKPFELDELFARMRALLRRPEDKISEVLVVQDIQIDSSTYTVTQGDNEISLTLKEYEVLEYLIRNKDRVLTRGQILDHCWDFAFNSFSNIVDVYIKQLRKKLNEKTNHRNEKYIKTIRGVGYQMQG